MAGEDQKKDGATPPSPPAAAGTPPGAPLPPGIPKELPPIPGDSNIIGTVMVGGRKYATSLIWNTAIDPKHVSTEAHEAAQRLEGNGFCIYTAKGGESIYGLAEARLGHKSGQVALAARLAELVEPSFVGAFITEDNRYWLVGIVDEGRVVFDKAYEQEEVAREEFLEMIRLVAWKKIACPPGWQVDNANHDEDLAQIVGTKYTGPHIRSLGLVDTATLTKGVTILIVCVIAFCIIYILYEKITAPPPPAPPRPVRHEAVKVVVTRPWTNRMHGDEVLTTCVHQILTYGGFIIAGWNGPSAITCNEGGVFLTLSKGEGTMNWVTPNIPKAPGFEPKVTVDFATANVTWPLPGDIPRYKNVGRGDIIEDVRLYLLRNLDEIHQPITLKPSANDLTYHLTVMDDIRLYYPFFIHRFATHVVNNVTVTIPDMIWTVDGQVFADKPDYKD